MTFGAIQSNHLLAVHRQPPWKVAFQSYQTVVMTINSMSKISQV